MIKLPELDRNQIIIIFAIIGLLTVIVTLFVFLGAKEEESKEYMQPELAEITDIMEEEELTVSDFIIEHPELLDFNSDYYLIREQYKKWDWIQAEKYWINIKSILIDILSKENDSKMEDLINSIP